MPNWWQSSSKHHELINAEPRVGVAIAALKLYIDLCCRANYKSTENEPVAGSVKKPLETLALSIGGSKPTLIAAIKLLEQWGLIYRIPGRPQTLVLEHYDAKSWTKIPAKYLRHGIGAKLKMIAELPSRGANTRRALQFYLYLASIRNRYTLAATVSYARIAEVLGCTRNEVSTVISVLSGAQLIAVRRPEQIKQGDYASNIYTLLGSDTTPLKVNIEQALAGPVRPPGGAKMPYVEGEWN
jgi:hypothetical protein